MSRIWAEWPQRPGHAKQPEVRAIIENEKVRLPPLLVAALLATALSGCADNGASGSGSPFTSDGGIENGPTSSLWGDTSTGPEGSSVGCIRGRHFAVLITLHNQSSETITVLGAAGPQSYQDVIERDAVQVRLAPPPPPAGFVGSSGLTSWNPHNSDPVVIPPGRDAWVQSNYSMSNCAHLRGHEPLTINQSTTLVYRARAGRETQIVSVPSAQIILTRGPAHPSVPVNQIG